MLSFLLEEYLSRPGVKAILIFRLGFSLQQQLHVPLGKYNVEVKVYSKTSGVNETKI